MTDQAKEEYLVPGAKAHMFHSALERKIEIFTKRARNYLRQVSKRIFSKVGCVFPMVVVSILPHAEFGQNDHREHTPHFR